MNEKLKTVKFQNQLLSWYHKHKRDLPWRRTQDPYCIWISEIMLQQTQVATVIDYYHRFLEKFPSIENLALAPEEEVLAQWSGLGYYSRARNLHKAAQKIMKDYKGIFPKETDAILSLPGIGRYTLGAIASIAFNQALPLVDGNVIRVYSRFFALKGSPSNTKFQKKIWGIAEEIINTPSERPLPSPLLDEVAPLWGDKERGHSFGDFNQALMELGATVCTPQNPTCLICPIQKLCDGKIKGPENFPEKKKTEKVKKMHRLVAVVKTNKEILLCLSEKHRWMKKLWQLPGLYANEKEGVQTLLNHLREMGLSTLTLKPLEALRHQITHHQITVKPFVSNAKKQILTNSSEEKYEWHSLHKLKQLGLPAADRKILERIL